MPQRAACVLTETHQPLPWFLQERFGLGDFRVQSLEAILRRNTLVLAAYAFVQPSGSLLTDPNVR